MQIPDFEAACYAILIELLHPEGLACPRCRARDGLGIHRRHRAPVLDYQCEHCGRVFNAWTGTPLGKTHRPPSQLLRILFGIAKGTSTAELARQLGCQRAQLLALRRRLVPLARALSGSAHRSAGVHLVSRQASSTMAIKDLPDEAGPQARPLDAGALSAAPTFRGPHRREGEGSPAPPVRRSSTRVTRHPRPR